MAIDATFWVGVSFIVFFGGLVYLKIPQKINEILTKKLINSNFFTPKFQKIISSLFNSYFEIT